LGTRTSLRRSAGVYAGGPQMTRGPRAEGRAAGLEPRGRGLLAPRRRAALAGDHREEGIAIALELGGADTAQPAERLAVAGLEAGHLDQRAVVEDHVGRDALRLGELEPAPPQGLEQRFVLRLVEGGARLVRSRLGGPS